MFKKILSARGMGQVLSVFAALIVMIIVFALINPLFFSATNITNLLRQVAPILIIGVGQSFVLITAGIDLSIGSVAGMSCMISATLMTKFNMNPILTVLITIICCLAIGLVNGLLIGIYSDAFKNFFYYGRFLGIYTPIWIAIVLFAFFAFILSKTALGRHVYALGSNYEAARLSGVNVAAAQTKVYVISSFLAGVVGLILTAQSGMGSMDAGSNYELNTVAASVIGGVSTMGGQGMLLGTVIGAFIWGVLNNGLQFAGAPLALRNIVIGIVVIISVLIDRIVHGGKRLNTNAAKGLKLGGGREKRE